MSPGVIRVAATAARDDVQARRRAARAPGRRPRTPARAGSPGSCSREVERRRPRGGDDAIRRDRGAHRRQAGHVVGPVVHRVVRDVDDVVAGAQRERPGPPRRPGPGPRRDRRRRRGRRAGRRRHGPIVAAGRWARTMRRMTDRPAEATRSRPRDRLLIDGSNLLHALHPGQGRRRGAGRHGHRPAARRRPGVGRDRPRLRRPVRARPARRADRLGADRPLQRAGAPATR